MKFVILPLVISTLFFVGCGGGSGGSTENGSSSSASSSNSSAPVIPEVPVVDQSNPLSQMDFFIKNAKVDLREITLEQAWEYKSEAFVNSWKYYHLYHAPKTIIENWVFPDFDGLSVYPIRINVDGDVSYLTVNKLFTTDDIYEAMVSSVNFMQDDVDQGEYCYINSFGDDYNAAINSEELRVGAQFYKKGSKLKFIPAYDNSLFAGLDVPKAPKLAVDVNGKKLVFFFNHNPDNDQQDGKYVIGVYYDGKYYSDNESLLSVENNNFYSDFVDRESKLAINLRTTRYEQGAVDAFKGQNLVPCDAEPISRSGLKLNTVYETPFDVEGVQAKAYIHIAEDGLISSFTDDIENWNNCLNTGVLSRKNGEMDGVRAQYNREGHYIFIKDKSLKTFRLILDTDNKVTAVWAFDVLGEPLAAPSTSFVNYFNALSTTVSSVPLSDLQAAVCSTQQ